MNYTCIEVEQQDAVRRLWLNRPEARNAQSMLMLDELDAALKEAAADDGTRVVVLGARGGHFSAQRFVEVCCTRPAEVFGLTRKGRILNMPYPVETNDSPMMINRLHTAEELSKIWIDQFDEMLEQSRKGQSLVCPFVLHTFILGQPFRLRQLRRAMEHILAMHTPEARQRYALTPEQWASIKAPTLVLWTSHDPTAPVETGRYLASLITGARFEVMDGCGHWPQFEDAPTFNRIHLGFLLA